MGALFVSGVFGIAVFYFVGWIIWREAKQQKEYIENDELEKIDIEYLQKMTLKARLLQEHDKYFIPPKEEQIMKNMIKTSCNNPHQYINLLQKIYNAGAITKKELEMLAEMVVIYDNKENTQGNILEEIKDEVIAINTQNEKENKIVKDKAIERLKDYNLSDNEIVVELVKKYGPEFYIQFFKLLDEGYEMQKGRYKGMVFELHKTGTRKITEQRIFGTDVEKEVSYEVRFDVIEKDGQIYFKKFQKLENEEWYIAK